MNNLFISVGVKNNYTALAAPGVNDDASAGYEKGSTWIDNSASPAEAYKCTDETIGAAVWINTTFTAAEAGAVSVGGDCTGIVSNITVATVGGASAANIAAHITSLLNPHGVTAAQAGAVALTLADAIGDTLYASADDTWAKLSGNITTTKKFLSQTGDGANSAAPVWEAVTASVVGAVPLTLADALGDMFYASADDTWAKLSGNATTTKKFLTQTGDGANSAAPAWGTVTATDVGLGNVANKLAVAADGTQALTANWNAGAFTITASKFTADRISSSGNLLVAPETPGSGAGFNTDVKAGAGGTGGAGGTLTLSSGDSDDDQNSGNVILKSGEIVTSFGSPKTGDVYVITGDHTFPVDGSSGNLYLKTADASGSASGNISMDVGNAAFGINGSITIGGTRATAITIGRSALATLTISAAANGALLANAPTGTVDLAIASVGYAKSLFAANDAMLYKGSIDCSSNPDYPAADAGHAYKISVAGKIGGASGVNVEVGDLAICTVDSSASGDQAAVGVNWDIIQVNLDGAVIGPSSATNTAISLFDGASGRQIKNSLVTIDGSGSVNIPSGQAYKINSVALSAADVSAVALSLADALGDTFYASADNTWAKLSGDTSDTRKFMRTLSVAGTAQAPVWDTVTKTDVGLSNVENTALSTWAGSANITTLGTIGTGVWQGTTIKANYFQAAAADLGAANVTVNLSNSNGSYVTNFITDGYVSAMGFIYNNTTAHTSITGSQNIDWSVSHYHTVTIGNGAVTFTFTAPAAPAYLTLKVTQYSTAQTVTWPTILGENGTRIDINSINDSVNIIYLFYDGSSYHLMGTIYRSM